MVQAIEMPPGVTVLQNRVCVTWGDFSMVDATLLLLRAARASGEKYDFASLHSGQDLLVRAGLHEYLQRNVGAIYMASRKIAESDPQNNAWTVSWPKIARNTYEFPYHPFRLMRAGLRALYARGLNIRQNSLGLPTGWEFYRGSQWMCLPRDVVEYILNYVDGYPEYCDLFRNSLVPDEFFFTTLIMNSPHAYRVAGYNLTHVKFGQVRSEKNHPTRLTVHNIEEIESSGRFFARKFDERSDSDVIRYFLGKHTNCARNTATNRELVTPNWPRRPPASKPILALAGDLKPSSAELQGKRLGDEVGGDDPSPAPAISPRSAPDRQHRRT
jgi:hypothetical protein